MQIDFVQYLRDRGLVSDALAASIRAQSADERIPLGRLLLEQGAMTVRDVMKLLTMQADAPSLRFGELAIREGLITCGQLEAALMRQRSARNHQIDVVRKLALLTPCELQGLVVDYVRFLELRVGEDDVRPSGTGQVPIAVGQ